MCTCVCACLCEDVRLGKKSATGRARVARMRAEYPNQPGYGGSANLAHAGKLKGLAPRHTSKGVADTREGGLDPSRSFAQYDASPQMPDVCVCVCLCVDEGGGGWGDTHGIAFHHVDTVQRMHPVLITYSA